MEERYKPPQADLGVEPETKQPIPLAVRALMIAGTAIGSSVIVGFLLAVVRVVQAADVIFADGAADEVIATRMMGEAMAPFTYGSILGTFGLLISFTSVTSSSYRPKWFFWSWIVLSLFFLFVPPMGTLLGIVFLIYLLVSRRDFFPPPAQAS